MRVQVKDTKLVKDMNTGAILNTDSQDKINKLALKEKRKLKEKRMDDLENKINELTKVITNLTVSNHKLSKNK